MPEKYKWPTITGLYQPIDYGNIKPFDTTAIRNTAQSMTDLVHALGFKTKEEEEEERRKIEEERRKIEEERRKAEFGHAMLSVPAFPGDVPATSSQAANYYLDGDVEGAKATQAKQDVIGTTAAITSLSLPYSFSTIGTIPTLLTEAASIAGGYGGYKLGEVVDNKLGTKVFAPTFSFIGGMGSGIGSYKGLVNLGTKGWLKGTGNMYGKQFMGDVAADVFNKGMKQGNPYLSTYLWKDFLTQEMTDPDRAVHVSHNPMSGKTISTKAAHSSGTKWVPGSAERSLVEDNNMIWLWEGKPYRNQWNDQTFISVPKSNNMVQTRQARAVGVPEIDLTNPSTKIITRNPITGGFERQLVVSPAQPSKGSYAFFERPSKLTLAERMGIPKGERNNGKILLSMQELVPSKFTSVPGFKPIGGKMIADKVANHPHILDRTRRLQRTYKRIVDPDYTLTNNWRKSRNTSPGMKIVDDIDVIHTNNPTGNTENIGGYYNPSEDVIYVRRRGTLDAQASTAFHEGLHGYNFGQDEINDWVIKHLIDPEKVKEMSPQAQKYYLSSQEAPVHALQHGFNKGLDIGAPYPGDTVFDELLDSGIGGSLYYFKTQTPKDKRRLWRAMTGDLFVKKQGGKIENPDH